MSDSRAEFERMHHPISRQWPAHGSVHWVAGAEPAEVAMEIVECEAYEAGYADGRAGNSEEVLNLINEISALEVEIAGLRAELKEARRANAA